MSDLTAAFHTPDDFIYSVILTMRDGSVESRIFPTRFLAMVFLDAIPAMQVNGDLLEVASARLEPTGMGLN